MTSYSLARMFFIEVHKNPKNIAIYTCIAEIPVLALLDYASNDHGIEFARASSVSRLSLYSIRGFNFQLLFPADRTLERFHVNIYLFIYYCLYVYLFIELKKTETFSNLFFFVNIGRNGNENFKTLLLQITANKSLFSMVAIKIRLEF